MGSVFVTTYEIVGEGRQIAAPYYAEVEAAQQAHWDFVREVAGVGFRPEHGGGLRSVFFAEQLPTGWRRVGRESQGIEAVPRKSTKAGKAAADAIAALPRRPEAPALARLFGYDPRDWVMDGFTIYFPSEMRTVHPEPRMFLRLPRVEGDGFAPNDEHLRALPESDFMAALSAHNIEAQRLREEKEAVF